VSESKCILILSPDEEGRDGISASMGKFNLDLHCCAGLKDAGALLQRYNYSVVFCSERLADGTYADVISAANPVPVVVFSRLADWRRYLEALNAGAFDYIACPPNTRDINHIIKSTLDKNSCLIAQEAPSR